MDIKTTTGLWLMPTRGRVNTNLPRFFAAAKATGMTTPGALLVDADEYAANSEAYDALDLPGNWTVHVVNASCTADATQQGYHDLCDGLSWIGWLADDLVPETPEWDRLVIEVLTGWNFVSSNYGMDAPAKANGATVWSGDLVRAVGYLYAPDLRHYYIDTLWEELGRLMNCWHVRMDVMMRHVHESQTGQRDATGSRVKSHWEDDEAAYIAWCNTDRIPSANRIGEMMTAYGIGTSKPDLSGVSLMLATPCGSGRYERLYVRSLIATLNVLKEYGATVNWSEMPYCADISLARNKLFGAFYRSKLTHLLMIDDDMGWQPQDIVRMLQLKRDFVAAAGPRKVFPPSFAVNNSDNDGNSLPIYVEAETSVIPVTEVGMAFTLLSRECALRMRAAYSAELGFRSADGREELGVFNPIVVDRRYFSEDFAFCWRWRKVGGHVHILSDVTLDHVGSHTWRGAWLEQLNAIQEQQTRRAA